jgi:hypothetical protein
MKRFFTPLLTVATLSLTLLTAQAHSVWIEKLPDGQLAVRFAEWGEEFETSPGHLDSFDQVSASTVANEGKPQAFEVSKKPDHFLIQSSSGNQPTFAQLHFTVRKLHADKPARAPIFYCRWQPEGAGAGTPALTMDLVPTDKLGEARRQTTRWGGYRLVLARQG